MEKMLTIKDCMATARCGRPTILKAIKTGELPAARIGKKFVVRPEDLQAWIDQQFRR